MEKYFVLYIMIKSVKLYIFDGHVAKSVIKFGAATIKELVGVSDQSHTEAIGKKQFKFSGSS